MIKVPINKNYELLLDDEDINYTIFYTWSFNGRYVNRHITLGSIRTTQSIHRFLTGCDDPTMVVDHIDGNPLNNQKSNLRVCTQTENIRNRKLNSNNTSGFKGVSWIKRQKKWKATITLNKKQIHLGYFFYPEEAYAAYKEASTKYHKEYGRV